jgi:dTDP-4-amino-4,6-dideoxygalactose transaminase
MVECPYGEALMSRGVNFLMGPSFTDEDTKDIVHAIRKVVSHYR